MRTNAPAARLSPRQLSCLRWVAAGKTSWETARILCITERTVNFHLQNAYARLGVHTRAAAIATAMREGALLRREHTQHAGGRNSGITAIPPPDP